MGGKDFAAVKIDYDGKEIWRWQVRWPVSSRCPVPGILFLRVNREAHAQATISNSKRVLLKIVRYRFRLARIYVQEQLYDVS